MQRTLTSSEHDRRMLQEKLDLTRQQVNETKKQNHALLERLQALQNDLADSEVRRSEVEAQIRQLHTVIEICFKNIFKIKFHMIKCSSYMVNFEIALSSVCYEKFMHKSLIFTIVQRSITK